MSAASAGTLKEAIINAEKQDPTLNISVANKDAAYAGIDIARAKLLPNISAQGTYNSTNYITTYPGTAKPSVETKATATNSQLYFRQALFRLRDWKGLSISELQYDYSNYKLASSFSDLWLRVANAWFDLVSAQEVVNVQLEAIRAIDLVAKQSQRSYEAGQGTKDAAYESKAQLALVKSNLVEAEGILDSRQRAFEKLTGISYQNMRVHKLPLPNQLRKMMIDRRSYIDKALVESPDILAARTAELIRREQLKQVSADHYPTLDIIGSVTRTENDNVNQLGYKVNSSAIGVQLVVPIFSGGGISAQEKQAAAYAVASESERMALEIKLKTEIDAQWSNQESTLVRVEANQDLVNAALESTRAMRMGLKAGIKSWADVGNSELLLARRRVDFFNSIAQFKKIQARLLGYLSVSDRYWDIWLSE